MVRKKFSRSITFRKCPTVSLKIVFDHIRSAIRHEEYVRKHIYVPDNLNALRAKSNLSKHTAIIIFENHIIISKQFFDHNCQEPEDFIVLSVKPGSTQYTLSLSCNFFPFID